MMDWETDRQQWRPNWTGMEPPNVTAVRGNLYTIYQLIEFGKYHCLMPRIVILFLFLYPSIAWTF